MSDEIKLNKYQKQAYDWTNDYLGTLKGATIVDAFASVDVEEYNGEQWVEIYQNLLVDTKDGKRYLLTVQRDSEDNGPGFLGMVLS